MIIAGFFAVCADGTDNYGIFDNKKLLIAEYHRIRNRIEHDGVDNEEDINRVEKCFYKRDIKPNEMFIFNHQKFILVKPVKDLKYDIDFWPDEEDDDYKITKEDLLLVDLDVLPGDEIGYAFYEKK